MIVVFRQAQMGWSHQNKKLHFVQDILKLLSRSSLKLAKSINMDPKDLGCRTN